MMDFSYPRSVFPPSLPRQVALGGQVHGLREARSRCHCGCLNSIWAAIGASILGAKACFHGKNMGNLVVNLVVNSDINSGL
jgi:hypothetical protein